MERFHGAGVSSAGVRVAQRTPSTPGGRRACRVAATALDSCGALAREAVKIALVVPGGVDRSGEYRIIPVLLALMARLSLRHDVHVFALHQEVQPASWDLAGSRIHNIGAGNTAVRAIQAICAEHRSSAFQAVQSIWSGGPGLIAVSAAKLLRIPSFVH